MRGQSRAFERVPDGGRDGIFLSLRGRGETSSLRYDLGTFPWSQVCLVHEACWWGGVPRDRMNSAAAGWRAMTKKREAQAVRGRRGWKRYDSRSPREPDVATGCRVMQRIEHADGAGSWTYRSLDEEAPYDMLNGSWRRILLGSLTVIVVKRKGRRTALPPAYRYILSTVQSQQEIKAVPRGESGDGDEGAHAICIAISTRVCELRIGAKKFPHPVARMILTWSMFGRLSLSKWLEYLMLRHVDGLTMKGAKSSPEPNFSAFPGGVRLLFL